MSIIELTESTIPVLVDLAKTTFVESHGHSAAKVDIDSYIHAKINFEEFAKQFQDPNSYFRMMYNDTQIIGYSKIIINCRYRNIPEQNVSKLERIYLLEEFIGQKLGLELLNYNIALAKSRNQSGIWLYTWIENHRGIAFYLKAGFEIIGKEDFKISDVHSNPNHIMYKKF